MTITENHGEMVIQARDWGWVLEECQTLKNFMGGSGAKTCARGLLFPEYSRVLYGLHYLLVKAQSWYRISLSQLFLKSRDFHSIWEVIGIGTDHKDNWVLGFNFNDYPQLYEEDRLGWCLANLLSKSCLEKQPRMQYLRDLGASACLTSLYFSLMSMVWKVVGKNSQLQVTTFVLLLSLSLVTHTPKPLLTFFPSRSNQTH